MRLRLVYLNAGDHGKEVREAKNSKKVHQPMRVFWITGIV